MGAPNKSQRFLLEIEFLGANLLLVSGNANLQLLVPNLSTEHHDAPEAGTCPTALNGDSTWLRIFGGSHLFPHRGVGQCPNGRGSPRKTSDVFFFCVCVCVFWEAVGCTNSILHVLQYNNILFNVACIRIHIFTVFVYILYRWVQGLSYFFCCSLGESRWGQDTNKDTPIGMNHELSLKVIASTQLTSVESADF